MKKKQNTTKRKKIKKQVPKGIAHVHSTFNNTLVTMSDEAGNVLCWSSAGALGVKGTKKSTPYVAQMVGETAAKTAMEHGMKECRVEIKGPGPGRAAAVRSLGQVGLKITEIKDVTPLPHNGVRPPKKPRG